MYKSRQNITETGGLKKIVQSIDFFNSPTAPGFSIKESYMDIENIMNNSQEILIVYFSNSNTKRIVETLILPDIPYVYVSRHWPVHTIKWWKIALPINKEGKIANCHVRNLEYDILFSTGDFYKYLDDVIADGFTLYQSYHKIPDTFLPNNIKNNFFQAANSVGIVSCIDSPAKDDIIHFSTSNPNLYKDLLMQKEISDSIMK